MTFKNYFATFMLLITFPLYSYSHGVAIVDATNQIYFQLNTSTVEVNVKNQIAVVKSNQVFINNTGSETRVKFAFPLPEGANPTKLRWNVNGEWKEAEVSGNAQNTELPSNGGPSGGGSGSGGGVPSFDLQNYLGEHALFFDLADYLEVGQSIEFELSYVQLLPYSFGEVTFDYPNNYNLIQPTPIESNVFTFNLESERTVNQIDLLNFEEELSSNMDNTITTISYEGINEISTDNFTISYELQSDQLGVYSMSTFLPDSLVTCDPFGNGFVSMIIEPESNENVDVIQKNFTLVIDRSGSMAGDKMTQAKDAAKFIVSNLNDGDLFNIVDFSTGIESFSSGHLEANPQNVADAINYIDDLIATGGTNINESLLYAIDEFEAVEQDKANIIIFFTDGLATQGITSTEGIVNNVSSANTLNDSNIFLFTFGIGENVDKPLLTLLARENSGLVNFLEDQDLEEEITNFFLKVNNPVLINTSIEILPAGSIQSFHPSLVPNLYKGQQLIISGRYNTPQDVNIVLEGMAFNLPVSYDFPIKLNNKMVSDHSFLPKIWAKQKIDELSLDYILASTNAEAEEIQNSIDEISTCYQVVSVAFSSFEDTTLEVDLASFEVHQEEEDVVLEWTTLMELNNDHFIIERSEDANNYEEIGKVEGAGNSTEAINYRFVDRNPIAGVSYYRLKIFDIDGRISYSEVKVIIIDNVEEDTRYLLYPNPLPQGENLFIDAKLNDEILVLINNADGRTVYRENTTAKNYLETPNLIPGNYVVCITLNDITESFKLFVR